ncbi:MAG TPA: PD-(D/E)XK nuclease family protein [Tepidisphaeraceae bacterium]|jgi:putative RecB family exonuclease|nr:PD-(D/E)XK nuclease family protein [Tepidisphaeraceae bacterium]
MTAIMARPACAPAQPRQRAPNLLAEKITGRTYLSHSQLSLMRTCPRKFSFLYVEKTPPDFVPNSLIFGGAIHAAVEFYFRCELEGLDVTYEALMSAYHDAWRRQLEKAREQAGKDVPVQFNKTQDADALHNLAGRMITAFLASSLANPKGVIVGIEEELRVELSPELPDVLAKVDLVTQTEGWLHVVDFKTSKSSWTEEKARESAEQLVLYGATLGGMSRSLGLPIRLHFAVLTKHKTPRVQLLPVATDAASLDVMRDSVGQIWQAIQTGNFYPSPSPMNCTTCPYKSKCPVFAKH